MKRLEYFILDLEEWNQKSTCDFCSGFMNRGSKAICQIRTRKKMTGEFVANSCVCENCRERFLDEKIPKCERCERLQTESNIDIRSNKYICDCIRNKEDLEEKELPNLPYESQSIFYERQINTLREELNATEVEAQTHLDAMEAFEVYNKKHRQELLDRIKELEVENKRLKDSTPQELLDEINKLKERVKELEGQTAQIEVKETKRWPWKLRK